MTHAKRLIRCLPLLAGLGLFGISASTEAGPMTHWSGASASVQVLDRTQTESGDSATVGASSSGTIPYQSGGYAGYTNPGHIYFADVQGVASAQANGQATNLLNLNASYSAADPGTLPIVYQSPHVQAAVSWRDDSVRLQTPAGANLPEEIRLNFGLNYQVHSNLGSSTKLDYNPTLILQYNDTTVALHGAASAAWENQPLHPMAPIPLDSLTADPNWNLTGSFHLDLPINPDGTSRPFSLSLSTEVAYGLWSNASVSNSLTNLVLSLDSITLPDGTSVTDAGYGVSFASGMAWPQPNTVPEPTSVAVWTGLAAAGWWAVRRRRVG